MTYKTKLILLKNLRQQLFFLQWRNVLQSTQNTTWVLCHLMVLSISVSPFFLSLLPVLESLCNGSVFMCANGRCVPLGSVCNQHDDCGDRSDERNCHVNECLNRKVSGCTQDCQDLPVGYKVCESREHIFHALQGFSSHELSVWFNLRSVLH